MLVEQPIDGHPGDAKFLGGGVDPVLVAPQRREQRITLGFLANLFKRYLVAVQATPFDAEVLGLADRIGTLDAGSEADIVVLDTRATDAMALRAERAGTLAEELFILQVMGCDRAIAEVYVAGAPQKARIASESPSGRAAEPA